MADGVRAHDRFGGNGFWSPVNDDPDEDRRLFLEAARGGSNDALGELMQSYWHDVCRHFGACLAKDRRIAAKVSAGDLTQEVCLLVQVKFGGFRGQTLPKFRMWLFAIARNEWKAILRCYSPGTDRDVLLEQAFEEALAACHGYCRQPTPDEILAGLEQLNQLESAIAQLPVDQQHVVRAHSFEKLTFSEIAERLNRSRHAVERLFKAAIGTLRRRLKAAS